MNKRSHVCEDCNQLRASACPYYQMSKFSHVCEDCNALPPGIVWKTLNSAGSRCELHQRFKVCDLLKEVDCWHPIGTALIWHEQPENTENAHGIVCSPEHTTTGGGSE